MWNPPIAQPAHTRQRAEWAGTPSINEIPPPSLPPNPQRHQRDTSVSSPIPIPAPPQQLLPQSPAPDAQQQEQKKLRKKHRDQDRDASDRDRDRDRDRDHGRDRDRAPSVPSIDHQIRQIYAECESAHGKARLLSENVALANPDDVEADTEDGIIQEFYLECVKAQERVLSQISWATAEAEKSREVEALRQTMADAALALPAIPIQNGGVLASKAPTNALQARRGTVITKEEEMLGVLLGANQALTDAIQLRDDWQRAAIAQREERYVEERSRVETRIDRSVSHSSQLFGHFVLLVFLMLMQCFVTI